MDEVLDILPALDAPMIVVTTADLSGRRAGCLVGFHAQCSIEPLRYAIWLSKANHTTQVALVSTHLAVHFLEEGDDDLAELFGTTTGDQIDKFARCDVEVGPDGTPLLGRVANRLVGRRTAVIDEGSDHICFVVEPVDATSRLPLRPLRFASVRHLTPGHEAEDHEN